MNTKIGFYKNFLEEKMKKEIQKINEFIPEKCDFYYNFVDDELIGVVDSFSHTYLIILNSHKDATLKLRQDNFEYKIIRKQDLKPHISVKTYNKLLKRGLYKTEYSGRNNNNNYFPVHRLKACIRENILNKEVHHIDENPYNNDINNLKAMSEIEHKIITKTNRRKWGNDEEYISL